MTKNTIPASVHIMGCRPWPTLRKAEFEVPPFKATVGEIEVENKVLRIVDTDRLPLSRLRSIFAKEPTTIPWIETFTEDDIFVDIGGNIGIYTVYAGVMTGCEVFTFEPEALNFAELCKNIFVNGLGDRAVAFCAAINDVSKPGILHLGTFGVSYSHHDFDEETWNGDVSFGNVETKQGERLRQGCLGTSLDDIIEQGACKQPTHIKIDVDGLEHRVFDGMQKTLRSPQLKTCLIEIDFANPQADRIIEGMLGMGWKVSMDQLRTNRKAILTEDKVRRIREGKRGGFNYIFYRDNMYEDLFRTFLENYTPSFLMEGSKYAKPADKTE